MESATPALDGGDGHSRRDADSRWQSDRTGLQPGDGAATSFITDDGATDVPPFALPPSSFLDRQSRQLFVDQARLWEQIGVSSQALLSRGGSLAELRQNYSNRLKSTLLKQQRRYSVSVTRELIAGVPVHICEPTGHRGSQAILINIHGGGFTLGEDTSAQIESIPIAAVAGLRVVSVEYRLAPEYRYPAAVEDVLSVYRSLLRDHDSASIGIYGGSAGALLSAQVVSTLIGRNEAVPGALGLFALGAGPVGGDSERIFAAVDRTGLVEGGTSPYLVAVPDDDANAYPLRSPDRIRAFPPTLLISSTRDFGLSSVVDTHARLTAAGVDARLHMWEGLRHCFYYDPDFRESLEAYEVAAKFFNSRLLGPPASQAPARHSGADGSSRHACENGSG